MMITIIYPDNQPVNELLLLEAFEEGASRHALFFNISQGKVVRIEHRRLGITIVKERD